MRTIRMSAVMSIALGGVAYAGGFERTDQSVAVIFEEGSYAEIGFNYVLPRVDGVGLPASGTPGAATGIVSDNFFLAEGAFKADINDSFSFAIIYDEPYGANVTYPQSGLVVSSGNQATLKARALTGILQYNFPEEYGLLGGRFSLHAGPRVQFTSAEANLPFATYDATTDTTLGFGYLLGGAWERPDLGMRASLTYYSQINTSLDSNESVAGGALTLASETEINTPESLTLELQTGVTPTTLVFGSIRWVPWGDFTITPPLFSTAISGGAPLVFFEDNRITYRIGVGQKLTDDLSIFGAFGLETGTGSPTTQLTPVDGFKSVTFGFSYDLDPVTITAGARYAFIGDANTLLGGTEIATFEDNSLWAFGLKLGIDLN